MGIFQSVVSGLGLTYAANMALAISSDLGALATVGGLAGAVVAAASVATGVGAVACAAAGVYLLYHPIVNGVISLVS